MIFVKTVESPVVRLKKKNSRRRSISLVLKPKQTLGDLLETFFFLPRKTTRSDDSTMRAQTGRKGKIRINRIFSQNSMV